MDTQNKKYIQIMTNRPKDPGLEVTNYIKNYLEERGAVCTIYADHESADQIRVQEAEHMGEASCMIVLGGDGTLLNAARELADTKIPLLGVNLGTLGFLAEVELSGLDKALDRLLNGDYSIEERMMLSGTVLRKNSMDAGEKSVPSNQISGSTVPEGNASKEEVPEELSQIYALNDVAITRKGPLQVVRFRIWVNGKVLSIYGADGIVIATPTGSTGYNLSAGGPIVQPEAKLILLTPVCPHTMNTRSIVLSSEDEIMVEVMERESNRLQEVEVNFDGNRQFTLKSGDRICVSRSEMTTSVIRLSEGSFLERLHRKMSE